MMPEYERLSGHDWQSLTTPEDYHREVQQLRAENEKLINMLVWIETNRSLYGRISRKNRDKIKRLIIKGKEDK